uniref:Uncharacterized protein n=1 Tax=viral metagenome TaxID=1070528 RepID=A0A6C0JYU0_9ZZZZ
MEKANKDQPLSETNPENLQDIIKKIEADGERMLGELKKNRNVTDESVTNLMKTGEKEFIKKTGRRMTYGEIRQTHG